MPTGIKFFNWIGTMWKGQITFETPMLFAFGFLVTFLACGLTGVMLASPRWIPCLRHVSRSWRYGAVVVVDDPWGHGNSLEWATICPPPNSARR